MKIFLFILLLNFTDSYVLRKQIIDQQCHINKPILVKFDKNLCDLDFDYVNPFKFNDCNLLKQEIKNGLKMWYKNNDNIKIIYPIAKKNKEVVKNYIQMSITIKNIDSNAIGKTKRYCLKNKLIDTQISLNSNKCFYPDSYICGIENMYLVFIIFAIIGIHLFIPIFFDLPKKAFYLIILIVIFELILSIMIMIQCEKCSPLKGVIGHEFGHVIGLSHPDEDNYFNWNGKYDQKTCKIINKVINNNYDKKSIMISNDNKLRFKKHISEDDKLGLFDLYPTCNYKNNINDTQINQNNNFFMILSILLTTMPILFLIFFKILLFISEDKNESNNLWSS